MVIEYDRDTYPGARRIAAKRSQFNTPKGAVGCKAEMMNLMRPLTRVQMMNFC